LEKESHMLALIKTTYCLSQTQIYFNIFGILYEKAPVANFTRADTSLHSKC